MGLIDAGRDKMQLERDATRRFVNGLHEWARIPPGSTHTARTYTYTQRYRPAKPRGRGIYPNTRARPPCERHATGRLYLHFILFGQSCFLLGMIEVTAAAQMVERSVDRRNWRRMMTDLTITCPSLNNSQPRNTHTQLSSCNNVTSFMSSLITLYHTRLSRNPWNVRRRFFVSRQVGTWTVVHTGGSCRANYSAPGRAGPRVRQCKHTAPKQ